MIIRCEKCQGKFKIPDDKVTDKGAKVRCAKCQHTFRINRDGTPENQEAAQPREEEPAPASAPARKTVVGMSVAELGVGLGTPTSLDDPFADLGLGTAPPTPPSAPTPPPPATRPAPVVTFNQAPVSTPQEATDLFADLGLDTAAVRPAPAARGEPPPAPDPFADLGLSPPPPKPRVASAPPPPADPFGDLELAPAVATSKPQASPPLTAGDPFADLGLVSSSVQPRSPSPPPPPEAVSAADPFSDLQLVGAGEPGPAAPAAPRPGPPPAEAAPEVDAASSPPREDARSAFDMDFVSGGEAQELGAPEAPPPSQAPEAGASLLAEVPPVEPETQGSPAPARDKFWVTEAPSESEEGVAPKAPPAEPVRHEVVRPPLRAPGAESRRAPVPRPTSGRLTAFVWNGALLVVLVFAAFAVAGAYLNRGRLELSFFAPERAKALLAPPKELMVLEVSNGTYETQARKKLFFVRGSVKNRKGGKPRRALVRAEILDGDQTVQQAQVYAGRTPTPEELYLCTSLDDVEALFEQANRGAEELAPGAKASFLVAFMDYPPDLESYRIRVTLVAEGAESTATR